VVHVGEGSPLPFLRGANISRTCNARPYGQFFTPFVRAPLSLVGATIGRPFIGRRLSSIRGRAMHAPTNVNLLHGIRDKRKPTLVGATIGRPFATRHASVVFGRAMHAPTNVNLLHGIHDKRKPTLVGATIGRPLIGRPHRSFSDVQCTPLRM